MRANDTHARYAAKHVLSAQQSYYCPRPEAVTTRCTWLVPYVATCPNELHARGFHSLLTVYSPGASYVVNVYQVLQSCRVVAVEWCNISCSGQLNTSVVTLSNEHRANQVSFAKQPNGGSQNPGPPHIQLRIDGNHKQQSCQVQATANKTVGYCMDGEAIRTGSILHVSSGHKVSTTATERRRSQSIHHTSAIAYSGTSTDPCRQEGAYWMHREDRLGDIDKIYEHQYVRNWKMEE